MKLSLLTLMLCILLTNCSEYDPPERNARMAVTEDPIYENAFQYLSRHRVSEVDYDSVSRFLFHTNTMLEDVSVLRNADSSFTVETSTSDTLYHYEPKADYWYEITKIYKNAATTAGMLNLADFGLSYDLTGIDASIYGFLLIKSFTIQEVFFRRRQAMPKVSLPTGDRIYQCCGPNMSGNVRECYSRIEADCPRGYVITTSGNLYNPNGDGGGCVWMDANCKSAD